MQRRKYVIKAERALGKPLNSIKHPVHHHNNELVICENKIYHQFLHTRTDALTACGNANWRKCSYCKQYDDPKNLVIKNHIYHKACANEYLREWRN